MSATALLVLAFVCVAIPPGARAQMSTKRQPHDLRFRPVLAELPTPSGSTPGASADTIKTCDPAVVSTVADVASTPAADDVADECVVLPGRSASGATRYFLGPAALTHKDVRGAKSAFLHDQGYVVQLKLTKSGVRKLKAIAVQLLPKPLPHNEIAIVVDGVVQSTPQVRATDFADTVVIYGEFSQRQASDLARAVNLARR